MAIHADFEEPILFDDEDESLLSLSSTHTPQFRVAPNNWYSSISRGVRVPPEEAGFTAMAAFIADTLRDEGWLDGTVGLQLGSYRPNRLDSERFEAALKSRGAKTVDATDLVPLARRHKSPLEIQKIREAARIGDIGMRALVDNIREGVTELELYAAATSAMAAAGGELAAIPGMVNSGPKNAALHGAAGRRKIKRGDLINVDMCGVLDRYHSNLARCISFGEPEPGTRKAIDQVTSVYDQVRAAMRPGMPISELLDINEAAARELGIWEASWWVGGYDMGIAMAPDWVGRFQFSADEDPGDALLTPGLVMNHEWNYYLPNAAGIRELIDTLIVTDETVEFPHQFMTGLVVVD
ncbi:M24 family metallopeptidase [Streptomyces sp. NPDC051286]|uniref:M24 family metallopeptidase n=1 Tax=Streptomyces sp. NPDC051286 TaxID=3365647 RepID=UPI0037A63328